MRKPATASIGLLFIFAAQAQAHPTLVRSEPAAGGKDKTPAGIALHFSERIQPVFNRIEVIDAKGAHYEEGKAVVDPSNKSLLRVELKGLPVGFYVVKWRASGADSHPVEGSFRFEVGN